MKSIQISEDIWFKVFLWTGIVLVLIFSCNIIVANDLVLWPYWKQQNIAYFFIMFNLPIKTAAAFLTLLGFRAVIIRSRQAKNQIDITMIQVTYSNYVTHKEEFMKILNSIEKAHDVIRFSQKEQLYKMLFPDNIPTQAVCT